MQQLLYLANPLSRAKVEACKIAVGGSGPRSNGGVSTRPRANAAQKAEGDSEKTSTLPGEPTLSGGALQFVRHAKYCFQGPALRGPIASHKQIGFW